MKIIAIACNYAAHNNLPGTPFFTSEEPVVFSRADSALLKDGKPFFIPDFAADCRCQAELVVRLSRLGKSIPERFAYRYYDAVTVGIGFTAGALLERCRREGLPWELATGFDGAAAVGRFAPLEGRDMADLRFWLEADGTVRRSETPIFGEDDYVVNLGPQHPSTHGVLHFRIKLEGETIKKVDPILGYIHRGVEKMCEKYTYPQTLALTDRLDYLSAMMNRHALCGVIEEAMGVELTDRIQCVRTIMDELQRLDSHLLYIGCCAQDLGALTAFLYSMRDREHVLNAMEETTGGRLIQNYYRIGGLQDDIDPNFVKNVKELCRYIKPMFQEYMDVFGDNVIMQNRFKNVGPLSKADAISYGVSGASGRASGWHNDVRKTHPYAMYAKVDFDEVTNDMCDSMGRYLIRIEEMKQSVRIIEQLIDNIPEGDFYVKQKPIIKVPEGQWFFSCEGSRGEIGVYLDSRGDKSPYRLKLKPMGLNLVAAMDEMLRGQKVADIITAGAALDFVIPDIDR